MDDFDEIFDADIKRPLLIPATFRTMWSEAEDRRLSERHELAQSLAIALSRGSIDDYRSVFELLCGLSLSELKDKAASIIVHDVDQSEEFKKLRGAGIAKISDGFVSIHTQVKTSNNRVSEISKELSTMKRLAGPSNDDQIDEALAEVFDMSPWLKSPIVQIWRDAKSRVSCGRGFGFSPILLVGDHGCGKTQLASLVSSIAQVPSVRLDASGMTSGFDIAGTDQQWKDSKPMPMPATTISTAATESRELFSPRCVGHTRAASSLNWPMSKGTSAKARMPVKSRRSPSRR